jgi:dTDP-4-dehydrorhamnose 3,5-epimerase
VRREGNRATSVVYTQGGATREIRCAGVINTLPINEAVLMIEPGFGDTVERAARSLRFRSVVFVGLLVRRDRVLPSSFMYYRQHSFNRICDLAQFGFRIRPDGCTQLVAEISCDEGDRAWTDEEFAKEAVLADLVAEGLLTRAEVIETHVFRAEHAYPIYALGYEQSLAALLRAVGTLANMDTAGRQGRFQYVNAHIAMRMGYEAADRLAGERGGGARLRTVAHPRITTRNRDGTDNGFLVPIYNVHDRFVDERHHPEQVYLTVCKPGEQKGPHLHLRRWGYFTCIKGDVRIVARVNGSYVSEFSGENHEFRTIEVPAGVAATIQNIGLEDAYVLNTPSPAWRRDDQDEHDVKGWDWVSE